MAVPKQRKTKSRRNQGRSHLHLIPQKLVKCPKCGSEMKLRKNKAGKQFFGCSRFPKCRATKNIS